MSVLLVQLKVLKKLNIGIPFMKGSHRKMPNKARQADPFFTALRSVPNGRLLAALGKTQMRYLVAAVVLLLYHFASLVTALWSVPPWEYPSLDMQLVSATHALLLAILLCSTVFLLARKRSGVFLGNIYFVGYLVVNFSTPSFLSLWRGGEIFPSLHSVGISGAQLMSAMVVSILAILILNSKGLRTYVP